MKMMIVGGNGQVGQALCYELGYLGHETVIFSSKDDRSGFSKKVWDCDGVFIAIPTADHGEKAFAYITDSLREGKLVVTCEKGSLSWYFPDLREYLDRIGFSATVGGGSGMLSLFENSFRVKRIFGVVNATLNFLLLKLATGQSWESAVREAVALGILEPNGSSDLIGVMRSEFGDVLSKLCILFNLSKVMGARRTLRPINFSGDTSFLENFEEFSRRGFRVAIYIGKEEIAMIPVLFTYRDSFVRREKWLIQAGFVDPKSFPEFSFPRDRGNTLLVEDYSGISQVTGTGAGPRETAGMMIADMNRLMMKNQNRSLR